MVYRRYTLLVLVPIAAVSILTIVLAAWLQPVRNDLTRLGAYPERDFGWNSPQLAFRPPLVPVAVPSQPYDIVVIGDSFSTSQFIAPNTPRVDDGFWTDVFAQRTGIITGVFHRDDVPAATYLASKVFKAAPPRLLIYEIVERELDRVYTAGARCPAEAEAPGLAFELRPAPMDRFPVPHSRDTSATFDTARISTAVDVIIKQVTRWLTARDWTDVLRLPLSKNGLFSNRRSDWLLIYKGDLRKAQIGPAQEAELACYFRSLQSQVEADGRTAFLLMVVPDKSTTYAAYTSLPALPNMVEHLARDPALHTMRLDIALQEAVAQGRQDVYLPSDTHWGWAGKEIAADALVKRLLRQP